MIDFNSQPILYSCSESINESSFYIKDVVGAACEICSAIEGQLHVFNKRKKEIDFLKIDGCVYNSQDGKRCDCSLSTNEEIFFIEFKEKHDFSNKKSKRKSFVTAKMQIITTINNFKAFNINVLKTYGVIVLTPKLPHSHKQIVTACHQTDIADIFFKTGCPNLLIGNIIEI